MASNIPLDGSVAVPSSSQSDYGSDIDETALDELLSQTESQQTAHLPKQTVVLETISEKQLAGHDDGRRRPVRFARVHEPTIKKYVDEQGVEFEVEVFGGDAGLREQEVELVEYDELNRGSFSPSRRPDETTRQQGLEEKKKDGKPDTRTPLQRFRTIPKKPLSVTDLISPAWCELQYWYNLTKYGKIQPTAAMKQGSGVHKVLEEQVHGKEVAVEIVSREDAFALRLWNGIQSLRTLRVTGMTRELEVWGVVEGEVVIGIIDEISTTCPDEAMEAAMLEGKDGAKKSKPLEANQTTLTDFLSNSSQNAGVLENGSSAWLGKPHNDKPRTFYIVDIKTRQSRSLPKEGSPSRPTHMQLQLYHRLLSSLAANTVPAHQIFARYRLNPTASFSDTLIAQIGNLDFNFPSEAAEDEDPAIVLEPSTDAVTELLSHNNLEALWSLFITELQKSIPNPSTSISPLLTAEFRTASEGTLIGKRSFVLDPQGLETYVQDEMSWWRGERPAKGVEIEDAFKCGFCQFADGCEWRVGKIEEQARKMRLRREGRKRSEV